MGSGKGIMKGGFSLEVDKESLKGISVIRAEAEMIEAEIIVEEDEIELLKQIILSRRLTIDIEGVKIIKASFGRYYAQLKNGAIIEFGMEKSGPL